MNPQGASNNDNQNNFHPAQKSVAWFGISIVAISVFMILFSYGCPLDEDGEIRGVAPGNQKSSDGLIGDHQLRGVDGVFVDENNFTYLFDPAQAVQKSRAAILGPGGKPCVLSVKNDDLYLYCHGNKTNNEESFLTKQSLKEIVGADFIGSGGTLVNSNLDMLVWGKSTGFDDEKNNKNGLYFCQANGVQEGTQRITHSSFGCTPIRDVCGGETTIFSNPVNMETEAFVVCNDGRIQNLKFDSQQWILIDDSVFSQIYTDGIRIKGAIYPAISSEILDDRNSTAVLRLFALTEENALFALTYEGKYDESSNENSKEFDFGIVNGISFDSNIEGVYTSANLYHIVGYKEGHPIGLTVYNDFDRTTPDVFQIETNYNFFGSPRIVRDDITEKNYFFGIDSNSLDGISFEFNGPVVEELKTYKTILKIEETLSPVISSDLNIAYVFHGSGMKKRGEVIPIQLERRSIARQFFKEKDDESGGEFDPFDCIGDCSDDESKDDETDDESPEIDENTTNTEDENSESSLEPSITLLSIDSAMNTSPIQIYPGHTTGDEAYGTYGKLIDIKNAGPNLPITISGKNLNLLDCKNDPEKVMNDHTEIKELGLHFYIEKNGIKINGTVNYFNELKCISENDVSIIFKFNYYFLKKEDLPKGIASLVYEGPGVTDLKTPICIGYGNHPNCYMKDGELLDAPFFMGSSGSGLDKNYDSYELTNIYNSSYGSFNANSLGKIFVFIDQYSNVKTMKVRLRPNSYKKSLTDEKVSELFPDALGIEFRDSQSGDLVNELSNINPIASQSTGLGTVYQFEVKPTKSELDQINQIKYINLIPTLNYKGVVLYGEPLETCLVKTEGDKSQCAFFPLPKITSVNIVESNLSGLKVGETTLLEIAGENFSREKPNGDIEIAQFELITQEGVIPGSFLSNDLEANKFQIHFTVPMNTNVTNGQLVANLSNATSAPYPIDFIPIPDKKTCIEDAVFTGSFIGEGECNGQMIIEFTELESGSEETSDYSLKASIKMISNDPKKCLNFNFDADFDKDGIPNVADVCPFVSRRWAEDPDDCDWENIIDTDLDDDGLENQSMTMNVNSHTKFIVTDDPESGTQECPEYGSHKNILNPTWTENYCGSKAEDYDLCPYFSNEGFYTYGVEFNQLATFDDFENTVEESEVCGKDALESVEFDFESPNCNESVLGTKIYRQCVCTEYISRIGSKIYKNYDVNNNGVGDECEFNEYTDFYNSTISYHYPYYNWVGGFSKNIEVEGIGIPLSNGKLQINSEISYQYKIPSYAYDVQLYAKDEKTKKMALTSKDGQFSFCGDTFSGTYKVYNPVLFDQVGNSVNLGFDSDGYVEGTFSVTRQ